MSNPTLSQVDGAPAERKGDSAPAGPPGFDLLAEVGHGGMGVVWRARDLVLDREVAVKLLGDKYAPDSGTARRFVEEARITGQLQHPGIPAVYQVGTLADGRPFLAMKLIKGDTLADRLQAGGSLDPLGVFEAVAQAVGYAHARGVIHRDLKPANVMVGAFGEVQVLDWGLAKVLGASREGKRPADDPEATVGTATEIKSTRDSGSFTEYGSILGTPAFMAPEQAAGETDRTDARSDVFGLGAVLCVLLTGKPPFDGKDAESVRRNAVRGNMEAAFARLDASGADPEVVALCKRCLAAEPADRPASGDVVAAEVAALRRAADDRARQAERDKLAAEVRVAEGRKRRRVLVWAGSGLAAVLLLGLAGTTSGLLRADAARRDAETAEQATEAKRVEAEAARQAEAEQRQHATVARKEAEDNLAEARAMDRHLTKLLGDLKNSPRPGAKSAEITIRELLDQAAADAAVSFAGRPKLEAAFRHTLGENYGALGELKAAAAQFERSLKLRDEHLGPTHPDSLATAFLLGKAKHAAGAVAEAEAYYKRVIATREAALGRTHPDTLVVLAELGMLYSNTFRFQEGGALLEEAVRGYTVLPADHPGRLFAESLLAVHYKSTNQLDRADALLARILAAREAALGPDHPETLQTVHRQAEVARNRGQMDRAEALSRRALEGLKRALGADHIDVIVSKRDLAKILLDRKKYDEAVALYREAAEGAARQGLVRFQVELTGELLRHYQRVADPAGCRATAEMWEKLNRTDAGSLYDAACFRAITAAVQAKTPGAVAARLAQDDADRAMDWLTKAVAAGYKDRAHMEKDKDLAALRGRADFQKLLAGLPK